MATSEQLVKAQKVVIGLFNAAAGQDNLDAIEDIIDSGVTVEGLAGILAANPLFTGSIMGLASTTESQAAILLNHFGLSSGNEDLGSADAVAESYLITRINAGDDIGAIVYDAVNFLDDPNVPNLFKETSNELANKALVAATFSADQSSTSLGELQNVIAGVTGNKLWTQEEADEFIANGSGNRISLTTGQDDLDGTGGNDIFEGFVFNNSNTFQSGDSINGGAGNDKLLAEVGSSANFAISASTSSVETVHFDARSDSFDSNDNNLDDDFVQIDARNMRDVTEWGTDGSRADVVIEDIEINETEITEDITFRMKDTDPGSDADGEDGDNDIDTEAGASLHAYFEPNSLRTSVAAQDSVVVIRLLDPLNDQLNDQPLENLPVNGFFFTLDGQTVTIQDQAANGPIQSATTYVELADAIRDGLDAIGLTEVTVEVGGTFTESGTLEGETFTGTGNDIILTAPGSTSVASGGFLNGVGQTGDFITIGFVRGELSEPEDAFITANLILDNVGRGSEGGSAEIGSMSTRGGVEKFEVEVIRDSWLSINDTGEGLGAMRSTNDTLEVVDIVNAEGSTGYLYLGDGIEDENDLIDFRPDPMHVATNGLIDVRSVNAAEFVGNLKIGADITDDVFDRYLKPTDTDIDGSEADDDFLFDYNLGTGNDYLNVAIHSPLTADSDFSFIANGGAGDDSIRTDLDTFNLADYTAHKFLANLTVNGDAGNDTIETLGAGDFKINGGDGMDAIYADNTGVSVTIDGDPGTSAEQTITFVAAPANGPGGTITVDGVAVEVGEGWTATQIGDAVSSAFTNSTKFGSVVNAAGVVTFTYASEQVEPNLVTFADTDTTGVTGTPIVATVIGVPGNGAVSEVQTLTAVSPGADGNIIIGGTTIAVLAADTAAETAAKIAAGLSANSAFSSVVVGTNVAVTAGAALGDDVVVMTFDGTDEELDVVVDDTADTTGAVGVAPAEVVNAVHPDGGVSEVQTLTFTGPADGDGGTFTVDGVSVTAAAGDAVGTLSDLVETAFAGNANFTSVESDGAGVVTFTYASTADEDLILVVDTDSGVLSTITETTAGVAPGAGGSLLKTVDTTEAVTTDIEGITGTSHKAIWTANNQQVLGVPDNVLLTQDISEVASFTGIKGQLTVGFKGLVTGFTDIASTDGTTSAFQIRQALKDAIDNDAVLSKLLVVKDGPSNTFVIESLIDGEMDVTDLSIDFYAPLASADAPIEGRSQLTISDEANFTAFDAASANAAYAEAFGVSDGGRVLNGANSTIEQDSDNTINGGNGDDVIVLGTADNAAITNTTGTSNDTVVFSGDNFGTDTVVHFTIATAVNLDGDTLLGDDLLDFTAYLTADAKDSYVIGGSTLTDNDIIRGDHETVYTTADSTAANGVVLEIHDDDSNVMDVYKAESTSSSTEVTLTLVGTVDMADVAIASLTAADFV